MLRIDRIINDGELFANIAHGANPASASGNTKPTITDKGYLSDFGCGVVLRRSVSALVICLHVDEGSVIVDCVVTKNNVLHDTATRKRSLDVHGGPPPAAVVFTMTCLT